MPLIAAVFSLFVLAHAAAPADPVDSMMKKSPAELKQGIENQHPAVYYVLARKLFESGQKDEAVFWFYAGQLRYRFHLQSNPKLDPSGDPALFGSLSEVVGRPLNEYAFGDLPALRATITKVLIWDQKTANGFTSKTEHAAEWQSIRDGLQQLDAYLGENTASIKQQREANGLKNRR
jgi:hypothetical protein